MAAVASQALRSMRERSIRVLVTPTPLTFAERRSVLQVLEQHGPVEVFKMTPGYHGNFVTVTKSAASASRLVASSPLCYNLQPSPDATELSLDAVDTHPPWPEKEFKLEVFPEPDYQHRFASPSPLSRPWPAVYEQDRSFMATTLKQSLPRTIAGRGLAHWFLGLDRVPQSPHAQRLQLRSWLPSKMKR